MFQYLVHQVAEPASKRKRINTEADWEGIVLWKEVTVACQQGCGVVGKMSDSNFDSYLSKMSDSNFDSYLSKMSDSLT